MLGVMGSCYCPLDERLTLLSSRGSNEDVLRSYFGGLVGKAAKRQIVGDNPIMSQHAVERILQKLQAESVIEKVGAVRSTAYRKVATGSHSWRPSFRNRVVQIWRDSRDRAGQMLVSAYLIGQ